MAQSQPFEGATLSKLNKKSPNIMISVISTMMCMFTLVAVNFRVISQPQSELAIFVGFGLVLCFLSFPTAKNDVAQRLWNKLLFVLRIIGLGKLASLGRLVGEAGEDGERPIFSRWGEAIKTKLVTLDRWLPVIFKYLSWVLAAGAAFCCLFIVVQFEPQFSDWWLKPAGGEEPANLGNRAGAEAPFDIWVSIIGVILVLEATRRSIGWIVPILAFLFMAHSYICTTDWDMPEWLLPHKGQSIDDIAVKTFMQLGVFGDAAKVMFKFVFLFVLFGAFLELSGATKFIISFSDRVFSAVTGGPAMVSVLGSALMGTLSGSAVANAVTTGSFTIPMMRKSGFKPHIAGGIMAAAASGGALVPPVMGAGAYMMAELLQVEFLKIAGAAVIPAMLYYTSILLIVFLHARQIERRPSQPLRTTIAGIPRLFGRIGREVLASFTRVEGIVFFTALATLIGLLIANRTAFRAVSASLVVILLFSAFRKELKLSNAAKWLAIVVFAVVGLGFGIATWEGMPESLDKALDPFLMSCIAGAIGMMLFGLCHPEWNKHILEAFNKSAKNGVSLVAASACVGIIIAIVTSTGIAFTLSARIAAVVESNLLLALLGIMGCSLILGMGVPSVVCYLLVVTLMGPLLEQLGVTPLAAHLFIFYFGMMSMVTPPVALAAYASASIAQAPVMRTAFAAFRFALVGFTLPFMFIYNPSLLLLPQKGQVALFAGDVAWGVCVAVLGISGLAGGITGYLKARLGLPMRMLAFGAAVLLLVPPHLYVYRDWHELEYSKVESKLGAQFEKQNDGSFLVQAKNPADDEDSVDGEDIYRLTAKLPADLKIKRVAAVRIEAIPDERLPEGGAGRDEKGLFRLTDVRMHATYPGDENKERKKGPPPPGENADGSVAFDGKPTTDYAPKGQAARNIIDENPVSGWGNLGAEKESHFVILEAVKEVEAGDVTLQLNLGQDFGEDQSIGRFRITVAARFKFGWIFNLCGVALLLTIIVLNFRKPDELPVKSNDANANEEDLA